MIKRVMAICIAVIILFSSCNRESRGDLTGREAMPEGSSITIYCIGPDGDVISDYSQNETIQRMEEKYGIAFQFVHPGWGELDMLEEMFLDGNYCDIVFFPGSQEYKSGVDTAVADGVFWDLTDYIKDYMPNYSAIITASDENKRLAYDDDGRIIGLTVYDYNTAAGTLNASIAVGGMIVRADWLEEAGLDLPVTYDDWEEMLTVFRDSYGCSQPLYISGLGYAVRSPGMSGGFGAIPTMQMNRNTVEYGPETVGWKNYLKQMHRWYTEGLIGPEYITNDVYGIDTDACVRGETGAMLCVYHKVQEMETMMSGNARFAAVQYPVQNAGEVSQAGEAKSILRKIYITKAVSEEALPGILSMLDDLYDPEIAFDLSYGLENDTFVYNDQGEITYTDKILKNPSGHTRQKMIDTCLLPSNMMGLKDIYRDLEGCSDEEMQMCEIWNRDGDDLFVPAVTLTVNEQEICGSILPDIEDYVQDMANRMIVGAVDIDTEWPGYIRTLKTMGIDDAVKCYQDAYNRYMHR